jgi:hypothetical protein
MLNTNKWKTLITREHAKKALMNINRTIITVLYIVPKAALDTAFTIATSPPALVNFYLSY